MEIINKKSLKSKAIAAKTIMGHPRLSKIMFDAMEAPVGSTKRQQAKSILRSINKINNNFFQINDGQGGAGDVYGDAPVQDQTALLKYNMFGGGPAGQMTDIKMDPTGNPVLPVEKTTQTNQPTEEPSAPRQTIFVKTTDDMINKEKLSMLTADPSKNSQLSINYTPGSGIMPNGQTGSQSQPLFTIDKDGKLVPYIPGVDTVVKRTMTTEDTTGTMPGAQTPEGPRMEGGDFYSKELDNTGNTDYSAEDIYNAYASGGASYLDTWFNSLDQSQQDYYRGVYEAVKSGVGSETFSFQAMSDPEMLKSLGLTQDVLNLLPKSGLLSEQINDLREAKKNEYRIDEQLDRLLGMKAYGPEMSNDLTAYIRGKDQYLKQVDNLLQGVQDKIADMDTSNPYVANRMQNYTNYLTILKGRQTQRYIDFLKTGVDYYNAEMQNLSSVFDKSLSQAEAEFQSAASVSSEVYNNVKKMLSEMYNNISSQEAVAREEQRWQWEVTENSYNLQKTLLENQKLVNEINGVTTDYDKPDLKVLDEAVLGLTDNGDGTYEFNTLIPTEIAQRAIDSNQNPDTALNRFVQFYGADIKNRVASGNFLDNLGGQFWFVNDNNWPTREELVAQGMSDDEINYLSSTLNASVDKMEQEGRRAIFLGIKNYLDQSQNKIDEIRQSINDIVGKGLFTTKHNKEEYLQKYQDSLGDFAPIIYSMYETSKSLGNDDETFRQIADMNDQDFVDTFSGDLAAYISNNIQQFVSPETYNYSLK